MKISDYLNTIKISDTYYGYSVSLKPNFSEYYTVILYCTKADLSISKFRSRDIQEIAQLDFLLEGII